MKCHLAAAGLLIALLSTPTVASPLVMKKVDPSYVRGIGDYARLANSRGWTRRGERGRFKFILDCRRGKAV